MSLRRFVLPLLWAMVLLFAQQASMAHGLGHLARQGQAAPALLNLSPDTPNPGLEGGCLDCLAGAALSLFAPTAKGSPWVSAGGAGSPIQAALPQGFASLPQGQQARAPPRS